MNLKMNLELTEGSYIYCPALRYLAMDNRLNVYKANDIYVIATSMNAALWEHLTDESLILIGSTDKTLPELELECIPIKTSLDNVRDRAQMEFKQSTDVMFSNTTLDEKDTSTFGKQRETGSAFE